MASTAIVPVLENETALAAYFGFNMRQERIIASDIRIWILDPINRCLPNGERLFKIGTDGRISLHNLIRSPGKTIDHYNLKPFFYGSADFSLTVKSVDRNIRFRVEVEGKEIGGALTYEDLGIIDISGVEQISILLSKAIGSSKSYPLKKQKIVKCIVSNYLSELQVACNRELQEEGTPNGEVARDFIDNLEYSGIREETGKWADTITFIFRLKQNIGIKKIREMDNFCCILGGAERTVYYIYGDRDLRGKRYVFEVPYILLPPIAPIHKIIYLMNNRENREIFRGNNRGLIVNFLDYEDNKMKKKEDFRPKLPINSMKDENFRQNLPINSMEKNNFRKLSNNTVNRYTSPDEKAREWYTNLGLRARGGKQLTKRKIVNRRKSAQLKNKPTYKNRNANNRCIICGRSRWHLCSCSKYTC
jgi:hypothetical protein